MHTLETTSFRENYGFRFDCPMATLGSIRSNCTCIADLTVDKFVGGLLDKLIKVYSDAVKIKIVFFSDRVRRIRGKARVQGPFPLLQSSPL